MATLKTVEQALDQALAFLEEQTKFPFYLSIDLKNRRVTIHVRADDSPYTPPDIPVKGEPRIHPRFSTKQTIWVGPFKSYAEALATAKLLSLFHHRTQGEELLLANGRGVVLYPDRPF